MTTPPPDFRLTPTPPFSVSVQDVADVCTDLQFTPTAAPGAAYSTVQILEGTVFRWLTDQSALVDGVTADRHRIIDPARLDYLTRAARLVVIDGTAERAERAAHTGGAGPQASAYADHLWTRYTTGLAALQVQLAEWIKQAGDDVKPDPGATGGSGSAYPLPTITDAVLW